MTDVKFIYKELFGLFEKNDIRTTENFINKSDASLESDVVDFLSQTWSMGIIDEINKSTAKKFSFNTNSKITNETLSHSCLYSDFSIFLTEPVVHKNINGKVMVGGGNQGFSYSYDTGKGMSGKNFVFPKKFIENFFYAYQLINENHCVFLPISIYNSNSGLHWEVFKNFSTIEINLAKLQSEYPILLNNDKPTGYLNLKVPTLVGVPLSLINQIRQDEKDAFERFTKTFFSLVKKFEEKMDTEKAIVYAIEEVDDAIKQLKNEYKRIKKKHVFSLGSATVSLVTSCLCLFVGQGMGAYISGILGGTAGKEAVSSFGEYKNSLRELKKSDFYIPWLIMNKNK